MLKGNSADAPTLQDILIMSVVTDSIFEVSRAPTTLSTGQLATATSAGEAATLRAGQLVATQELVISDSIFGVSGLQG